VRFWPPTSKVSAALSTALVRARHPRRPTRYRHCHGRPHPASARTTLSDRSTKIGMGGLAAGYSPAPLGLHLQIDKRSTLRGPAPQLQVPLVARPRFEPA
jgi:hypothetical protein